MARYTGTVESVHPPEVVWDYLVEHRLLDPDVLK